MKVILKEDVKSLGTRGNVVNVASGYARNYLFPRKLAIAMTKSSMKALKTEKKDHEQKDKRALRVAKEMAEKIADITFKIKAKAGEEGKLFGSVTSQDVVDTIKEQSDFEFEKRKLQMEEHIKYLGKYTAKTKIHPHVIATINFEVIEE